MADEPIADVVGRVLGHPLWHPISDPDAVTLARYIQRMVGWETVSLEDEVAQRDATIARLTEERDKLRALGLERLATIETYYAKTCELMGRLDAAYGETNAAREERDGWREEARRLDRDLARLAETCADTAIGRWLRTEIANIRVAAYPDRLGPDGRPDWTMDAAGFTNASPVYRELVAEVERLIRGDAATIMSGRSDITARLIVSQLAHVHGLAPVVGRRGKT